MNLVKTGLQTLIENNLFYEKFEKLKLGIISNHSAVSENLEISVDALIKKGYRIVKIFAPEHGFRGDAAAGEKVNNYYDQKTKLPVISLYGESKKLPPEELKDIDAVIYDIQDIGVRYYTYIHTMSYAMQSCALTDKKFIVLDRPNPINGVNVEGTVLDEKFSSFIGLHPIPNRYGMTIGELASYLNIEHRINCDLEIVPLKNWKREMIFSDTGLTWVMPSLNTTCIDMALLYTGTCLIEGTNLSEGRGTTRPFEWIGAPWIDSYKWIAELKKYNLAGISFRPVTFIPASSKYSGEKCNGLQLHITDKYKTDFFLVGIILFESLKKLYSDKFSWIPPVKDRYFIDLLAGTAELRTTIDSGDSIIDWYESKKENTEQFIQKRKKYLLYRKLK